MKAPAHNPLNRQGIIWVLVTLLIAMFPQLLNMAPHLIPITLLPLVWRLMAEFRNWKPMPMVLRIIATAIAVTSLVLTFGGLLGRQAAVSLLVMMLSLKLLETFATRDARIVASLSLFLCATQFLFSQGILMIVYIIACVLSSLISLMYLHRREAFENLKPAPETDRNLFSELGFGARMMILALPVGLVLFMLFPRWGSPMWGIPETALDARSGLSNSMSPGSIQNLFMDDSPAFRVSFETGVPSQSELYWRGPVFWDFDGRQWKTGYLNRNLRAESKPALNEALFRYEVQMEPTEQHWVFALDYPALIPEGTRLSLDYQLISRRAITQLRTYTMASDPRFVDSPELKKTFRNAALALPAGFNTRTAEMMAQWRSETNSDAAIVQRALLYFNQQNFRYTLNPPLLSQHTVDEFLFGTRKGFCEHYASAFTVMMRMAGIPARVVTGYLGGYYSDFASYFLVRQSDAHAWSEVWIKGSGWTRIDPTAAVAPGRVERGSINSLSERRHMLDFDWLRSAKNSFDLLQRGWNNWVVAFDAVQQSQLFSGLGFGFLDTSKLVIAMILSVLAAIAFSFLLVPLLLQLKNSRKQDPLIRIWQTYTKKLEKAGITTNPSLTPTELAELASEQLSGATGAIRQITEHYLLCRYASHSSGNTELARMIKDFHPQAIT